jgi:nucleoside-diphosphate-sugar epimerase
MIYVLGGRGRLGQAILASLPKEEGVALDRAQYAQWWRSDSVPSIARFFERAPERSVVLVAAGLLDPALPGENHRRVNLELPTRVIEGACAVGLRVVTIGTVMERLVAHPNAYVATKAALARYVEASVAAGSTVTHLQVHTLYGCGDPSPFMFLGQMCSALQKGKPFEMSPGRQLREYHHVDDDVAAIHAILNAGLDGVLAISHGQPCTLLDLATRIFEDLGRMDQLRAGARPEPPNDNYATVLERPPVLQTVDFRPALQGVPAYVRSVLAGVSRSA